MAAAFLLAACASPQNPPGVSSAGNAPIIGAPASAGGAASSELKALRGLAASDLQRVFGDPDFRRAEPPAEFWQYRTSDCVLDIFLYVDAGQYRVAYAETHDRDTARASQSGCHPSLFTTQNRLRQTRL